MLTSGCKVNKKNQKNGKRVFVVFNQEEQERYNALRLKTSLYDKVRQLFLNFLEREEAKSRK